MDASKAKTDEELHDLRTIVDSMLEWSAPPMEEYGASVRVDGLLRQLEARPQQEVQP